MDELDTGAIALDAAGVIQAMNRPVREYLGLEGDLRGKRLDQVLEKHGLEAVGKAAYALRGRSRAHLGGRRGAHRAARTPAAHHHAQPAGRRRGRLRPRDAVPRDLARAAAAPLRRAGRRHRGLQRRAARDRLEKAREQLRALVAEAQESAHRFAGHGRARRAHLAHAHRDRELARRGRRARARGLPRRAAAPGPHARRDGALAAARRGAGARSQRWRVAWRTTTSLARTPSSASSDGTLPAAGGLERLELRIERLQVTFRFTYAFHAREVRFERDAGAGFTRVFPETFSFRADRHDPAELYLQLEDLLRKPPAALAARERATPSC